MDPNADKDRLFDDVFAEATPADFRGALLGETLRAAGRRRHRRQIRSAVLAIALPAVIAILICRNLPQRRTESAGTNQNTGASTSYQLVRTQPLPAGAIVTSRPLASEELVASLASVEAIGTRAGAGDFRVINDDELLAIVGQRPVALVRLGPDSELLIFANPEDEAGFPLN